MELSLIDKVELGRAYADIAGMRGFLNHKPILRKNNFFLETMVFDPSFWERFNSMISSWISSWISLNYGKTT